MKLQAVNFEIAGISLVLLRKDKHYIVTKVCKNALDLCDIALIEFVLIFVSDR